MIPQTLPSVTTTNAIYLMDQLASLYVLATRQNKSRASIRSTLKALGVQGMDTPEGEDMDRDDLEQFISDTINMLSALLGEPVPMVVGEWLTLTSRDGRTYITCTNESALPPGYESYDENNIIVTPAFVTKFCSDFLAYAKTARMQANRGSLTHFLADAAVRGKK